MNDLCTQITKRETDFTPKPERNHAIVQVVLSGLSYKKASVQFGVSPQRIAIIMRSAAKRGDYIPSKRFHAIRARIVGRSAWEVLEKIGTKNPRNIKSDKKWQEVLRARKAAKYRASSSERNLKIYEATLLKTERAVAKLFGLSHARVHQIKQEYKK